MFKEHVCALDIGSNKISAAVAEIRRKRVSAVYFDSVPSKGFREGGVVDGINLVNCVGQLLKKLKSRSGLNIKFVYTGISGPDIITKHSQAIIPLAERGNKLIMPSDVKRVNEQARVLGSSLEEEIIHQVPFAYTVDSKEEIINPLGLYGHRLKADLYLVCGKLAAVQSVIRVVNQAGFDVKDLFFSGLATAEAVFNREFRQGLNVLCDIGNDNIEIMVFKDGLLRNVDMLSAGGAGLTRRLAENLAIPLDLAEEVKHAYAVAQEPSPDDNKEILVKKNNIYHTLKQGAISSIASAHTKELCSQIRECIQKMVPLYEVKNVVTVGRAVLLEGFLETLEHTLGVSVRLGRLTHPDMLSALNKEHAIGQKYVAHLTALGLICLALEKQKPEALSTHAPSPNLFKRAVTKVKDIYLEYF